MAEEEDPWAFDETDTQAESQPAGGDAPPPAAEGGEAAPPAEGGEAGAEEAKQPPPEDDQHRRPIQLYRHWVRPRFLQYKYMYNYRTNYYDDVIDYLDKKSVGVDREIPRPQEWAERVLRTGPSSRHHGDCRKRKEDSHLIQVLASSIKPHNYHSRSYINLKYSSVL